MFTIFLVVFVIAIAMQIYSSRKGNELFKRTKDALKTHHGLLEVKALINMNMKMAIYYIGIFGCGANHGFNFPTKKNDLLTFIYIVNTIGILKHKVCMKN